MKLKPATYDGTHLSLKVATLLNKINGIKFTPCAVIMNGNISFRGPKQSMSTTIFVPDVADLL